MQCCIEFKPLPLGSQNRLWKISQTDFFKIWPVDKVNNELKFCYKLYFPVFYRQIGFTIYISGHIGRFVL